MTLKLEPSWWSPSHELSGAVRLFAFPCAGAEPGMYRNWPDLPQGVDLIAAHLAGRFLRRKEPAVRSLMAIVRELADTIAPLLDRPFMFLGHSMGGWVAYELIRELRARGLPMPFHLVLSGSLPIIVTRMPPYVHLMSLADLTQELRVLGGTPEAILAQPDVLALYRDAIQADFEAFETHVHCHQSARPVDVSLWAALDDPRVPVELIPLWRDLFCGRTRENFFEGGHMFILDAQNREKTKGLIAGLSQNVPENC